MATVKSWVASQVKRGESVKNIFGRAKKELTNWKIIPVVLWWMWYKGTQVMSPLLNVFTGISLVLLLWVITLPLFSMMLLTSPLWYAVLMMVAPKRAAYLLITELTQAKRGIWYLGFQAVVNVFCAVLGKAWGWIWKYQPMSKRQYYIDATGVVLNELSVEEQLEYYRLNPSPATVRKMSFEAVQMLRLNYVNIADIKNIGDVYEIYEELGKTMFNGTEEMFELLKGYCANEKKRITSEFIGFLIETFLKGEGGEAWSRASSLVLLCCEYHTLPDHQLKMLFASLGKEKHIGYEAMVILERYFSRHSFTDNVVSQVISFATDAMADECKEKNFELLCKIVRRDGWKTAFAEEFFNKCNSVQNAQMTEILKIRMDCEKVSHGSDNDNNRASWEQYCRLKQIISPDAQLAMREWQYDIFHQTHHELDAEVIYEFLVKRLSEEEKSYFEKVLDEEQVRETLNETALKLIMMTSWKRDRILVRLEASQKLDGLVL